MRRTSPCELHLLTRASRWSEESASKRSRGPPRRAATFTAFAADQRVIGDVALPTDLDCWGQVGSERSSAASLRGGGALSLWAVRQTSASTTKRRILRRSSSWSARSEDDALHPLETMAPCARPSPSQYVDADCGSAFQPFPRTSKNWGTNTEMIPMPPHHGQDAGVRPAHAACTELLTKGLGAHSEKQVLTQSPFYEAPSSVGAVPSSTLAHLFCDGGLAKSGSCYAGARLSQTRLPGRESNSMPLPMPFDSDFLLGKKQETGGPRLGDPADQGLLLPSHLGTIDGWPCSSSRDSTGSEANRMAQQALICGSHGDRPHDFKGLPAFLHVAAGGRLPATMSEGSTASSSRAPRPTAD